MCWRRFQPPTEVSIAAALRATATLAAPTLCVNAAATAGLAFADGCVPGPIPAAARSRRIGASLLGGGSADSAAPSSSKNWAPDAFTVGRDAPQSGRTDPAVGERGGSGVIEYCCWSWSTIATSAWSFGNVRPITQTSGVGELIRRGPAGSRPHHPGPVTATALGP